MRWYRANINLYFLVEISQAEKGLFYVILMIWHSRKYKIVGYE